MNPWCFYWNLQLTELLGQSTVCSNFRLTIKRYGICRLFYANCKFSNPNNYRFTVQVVVLYQQNINMNFQLEFVMDLFWVFYIFFELCSLHDYGLLQARRLEWIAISFSRGPSQLRDRTQVSCIAGSGDSLKNWK